MSHIYVLNCPMWSFVDNTNKEHFYHVRGFYWISLN